MTGNYFKIGIRLLLRQKGYTLLNIIGLTLGIVVFIFILLYLENEIRYDKKWIDKDNTYRITSRFTSEEKHENIALTPFRLANDLKSNFPEVKEATNLFFTDPSDANDVATISWKERKFEVPDISLCDENFFNVFDYPFLEGHPDSALLNANSIVISSEVAAEIFQGQLALGQSLQTSLRNYTVTGVIDQSAHPSHLNFDALVSVNSLPDEQKTMLERDHFWMTCYTYIQLVDTTDVLDFSYRFNEFQRKGERIYLQDEKLDIEGNLSYHLEPVTQIHFNTALLYDSPTNVDLSNLIIFGIIAAFILLTASINYINLATARSIKRSREIGVRKVLGASRIQLVVQYITESFIITSISFLMALAAVEWLTPQYNKLLGKKLSLFDSLFSGDDPAFAVLLIVLVIGLSVFGGGFPAFMLNRYKPAQMLQGNTLSTEKKQLSTPGIRHLLVTVQYVVSIGMIMSTLIVYAQLSFLNNHELGFNKENVLVVNVPQDTVSRRLIPELIKKTELLETVMGVCATQNVPGFTAGKLLFQSDTNAAGSMQTINYFRVGPQFFSLLQIPLVSGTYFEELSGSDTSTNYILNEAAVDFLGLDSAIGTPFDQVGRSGGKIVGVVSNFNSSSLHRNVEPLVFILSEANPRYIMIKCEDGQRDQVQPDINSLWAEFGTKSGLHFISLEEKLESLYRGDTKLLGLFFYFSLFVVFISSLGLYGLSSFLIQQRTREIGIRRVLGGSQNQLILMLSKGYLRLVLFSGLITIPLVYYLMNHWLDGFAYQISLHAGFFVVAILIALLIAFTTVLIRSFKITKEQPAVSLKAQ